MRKPGAAKLDSGAPPRAPGRPLRRGRLRTAAARSEAGFTFVELIVGLTLFAGISVFLLQGFIDGMTFANRSDERAAATSLAMQVMEQIKASPDPYSVVGFTDIARTPLPLPSPYTGISNPTPHFFQASVSVTADNNLNLSTVTVNIYRPQDPDAVPLATVSTILDAQ